MGPAAVAARDGNDQSESEDDWRSVFLGLAFGAGGELSASEGNSGRVRVVDAKSGKRIALLELNTGGYQDSWVTWHSIARAECCGFSTRRISGWPASMCGHGGRSLPFARAACRLPRRFRPTPCGSTSPTRACSNTRRCRASIRIGRARPGCRSRRSDFHRPRRAGGAIRETASGPVKVPGLGHPNEPESIQSAVIDVTRPGEVQILKLIPTGLPYGGAVAGGSSPWA